MITFIPLRTSTKVLKIINECIEKMIDMETDFLYEEFIKDDKEELIDYLSDFFPLYLCRENIEKCQNILKDLSEWTEDNYLHELGSVHEYALFKIMNCYFDEKEDFENYREKGEKNIYKFSIKDIENYEPEEISILKRLNKRDFFEESLFWDWDFLFIDKIVYLYQTNKEQFDSLGVNLRYYLDLMPKDMREDVKRSLDYEKEKEETEKFIINQINNVIYQMEMNPIRLEGLKEDDISDDIKSRLQFAFEMKNIIIEREARGGFAQKKIGEIDFYIYQNENHTYKQLAIGENKNWGNFENQVKQLLGYSNKNISFGFTITINRDKSYQQIKEKQIEILENFSNKNFEVLNVEEQDGKIISTHIIPEVNKKFKIYHFILNVNGKERKEIALEARNKENVQTVETNSEENKAEANGEIQPDEEKNAEKIKNNILGKIKEQLTFDDMKIILSDLDKILYEKEFYDAIKEMKKIGNRKRSRAAVNINNEKCSIQVFRLEDAPIMGFLEKIRKQKDMQYIGIKIRETLKQYNELEGKNEYVIKDQAIKNAIEIAEKKYGFLELLKDKKIDVFITNRSRGEYKSYLYKEDWIDNKYEIFIYTAEEAVYTLLRQIGLIVCIALCDEGEVVPKSFIKVNKKVKVNLLEAPREDRVSAFADIFAIVALRGSEFEYFAPFVLEEEANAILEDYFRNEIEKKKGRIL